MATSTNKSNYAGTSLFRNISGIDKSSNESKNVFAGVIISTGIDRNFSSDIQANTNTSDALVSIPVNFSSNIQANTDTPNSNLELEHALDSDIQADTNTTDVELKVERELGSNIQANTNTSNSDLDVSIRFSSDIQGDTNTTNSDLELEHALDSDIQSNTNTTNSILSIPIDFSSDIQGDTNTSDAIINTPVNLSSDIQANTNTTDADIEIEHALDSDIQSDTDISDSILSIPIDFSSDIQSNTNTTDSNLELEHALDSDIQADTNTTDSNLKNTIGLSSDIQSDTDTTDSNLIKSIGFGSDIQSNTNTSDINFSSSFEFFETSYSGTKIFRELVSRSGSDSRSEVKFFGAILPSYPPPGAIFASDIQGDTDITDVHLRIPRDFDSNIQGDTNTSNAIIGEIRDFSSDIQGDTSTTDVNLKIEHTFNSDIQSTTNTTDASLICPCDFDSDIQSDTNTTDSNLEVERALNSNIQGNTNTTDSNLEVERALNSNIQGNTNTTDSNLEVERDFDSDIVGTTKTSIIAPHFDYEDAFWLYVNNGWVYETFFEAGSHWWKFYAVKDQEYEIFTGESGSVFQDTEIYLHDRVKGLVPSNSLIDSNDDIDSTGLSKIVWTCDKTGVYYVAINLKDSALGSYGIQVTADIVNFVCPFLSYIGGRGELVEVDCARYKCDMWIKEFHKCFITHYNDTLKHTHNTIWHQKPHRCEDLSDQLGKRAPEALPVATVLHSEFIGKEDLDRNGEIYGIDFRIVDDEKLPPVLRNLMNSKEFVADKEVTLQSMLGKYFSSDIKARTNLTSPDLSDFVIFRSDIVASSMAEAKLSVGLLTDIEANTVIESTLTIDRSLTTSISANANTSNAELERFIW